MIKAPNLDFDWLAHGFGLRDSVPPSQLTTAKQIHSARVLDACGRKGEQIGEGDAIISSEPGVTVGVRTADCVPILLVDPSHRLVAAVHAGWRGTVSNIVGATVAELRLRGARPEDLCAAIGPSIGSCCYEVGPEVTQGLSRWQSAAWQPELAGSKIPARVNLPAINEAQLREAGVNDIWISGECTYCNPRRFFSFRREREEAGRMLTFVSRVG